MWKFYKLHKWKQLIYRSLHDNYHFKKVEMMTLAGSRAS